MVFEVKVSPSGSQTQTLPLWNMIMEEIIEEPSLKVYDIAIPGSHENHNILKTTQIYQYHHYK